MGKAPPRRKHKTDPSMRQIQRRGEKKNGCTTRMSDRTRREKTRKQRTRGLMHNCIHTHPAGNSHASFTKTKNHNNKTQHRMIPARQDWGWMESLRKVMKKRTQQTGKKKRRIIDRLSTRNQVGCWLWEERERNERRGKKQLRQKMIDRQTSQQKTERWSG